MSIISCCLLQKSPKSHIVLDQDDHLVIVNAAGVDGQVIVFHVHPVAASKVAVVLGTGTVNALHPAQGLCLVYLIHIHNAADSGNGIRIYKNTDHIIQLILKHIVAAVQT